MASFMLDLVTGRQDDVKEWLRQDNSGAIDKLGKILIDHNICDTREGARMVILPALITRGFDVGSPKQES